MSELDNLKQQILALAADAKRTSVSLIQEKKAFNSAVAQVEATVGNSSTGVDKKMVATLKDAEKKVGEAIKALDLAAREATNYANKI